jgi:hypothetical protein
VQPSIVRCGAAVEIAIMMDEIQVQLRRVGAGEFRASLDSQFEPQVGTLLKVERDASYWHLMPEHFLEMLKMLPADAGSDEVHRALETRVVSLWHGPSPRDSRDVIS